MKSRYGSAAAVFRTSSENHADGNAATRSLTGMDESTTSATSACSAPPAADDDCLFHETALSRFFCGFSDKTIIADEKREYNS